MAATIPISFVILSFNEEQNIGKCLRTIAGLSDDIHVVDSGSTDATAQVASSFGNVRVHNHRFLNFYDQWNWALHNLPLKYDWVFAMDSDFEIPAGLATELADIFSAGRNKEFSAFYVKHAFYFMGKRMRFGSHTFRYQVLLFRRDKVYMNPSEIIDKRFYVKDGRIGYLRAQFFENDVKDHDLAGWLEKLRRYAPGVAQEELAWRAGLRTVPAGAIGGSQAEQILSLKQLYYRLPLFFRPILWFCYDYFLRLGFLGGREGFILHFYRNLWYRMLIDKLIARELRTASRRRS